MVKFIYDSSPFVDADGGERASEVLCIEDIERIAIHRGPLVCDDLPLFSDRWGYPYAIRDHLDRIVGFCDMKIYRRRDYRISLYCQRVKSVGGEVVAITRTEVGYDIRVRLPKTFKGITITYEVL